MQTKGEQGGIVERLLEPDSHDPACPFQRHCYCDGTPHDQVSHPLASEAAAVITELLEALEDARGCVVDVVETNVVVLDFEATDHWLVKKIDAAIAKAKGLPS